MTDYNDDSYVERLTAWSRDFGDTRPQVFIDDLNNLIDEVQALRKFKSYTHERLDKLVERDPNPWNTLLTGCRVGSRFDRLEEILAEKNSD